MGITGSKAGWSRGLAVAALCLTLGCTPMFRNHGYIPPEEDLAQVTVGQTTRDEALALLGAPTATGLLNADGLYYVQSRFRHYGPFAPEEVDRQVLVVTVSDTGLVSNVERFGLEDGQIVALSRRVTDNGAQEGALLRQLFGALGNFDASQLIGDQ